MGYVASAYKITYSNDTEAAQGSANISSARANLTGTSAGSVKGYFAGGETNTVVQQVTTDKITYATSTTAAQASVNLTSARYNLVGFAQAGWS